jgi:glycosyltransferase involved in cell wall biosynthesis
MGRYVRHLSAWLRENAGSFDVLMVDAIREESMAAVEASRVLGCSVILRCSGWGDQSDPAWWQTHRSARKCGAIGKTADAVIVPSAACQRALLSAGYAASRIQRIDDGFAAGPVRSARSRRAARQALGAVNSDLIAEEDAPVLICASRMIRESGANLLVSAAHPLITRYPNLRLWFIGDGPYRDWMYQNLRREGVRASIAMPGSFCGMEETLAAADLFLQPDEDGLDFFLRSAISAELPIVTIDNESTRAVINAGIGEMQGATADPGSLVHWCSAATSKQIRLGIVRALDDLPASRSNASALRRLLLRTCPQSAAIGAYVELMQRLTGERSSTHPGASVEAAS